MNRRGFLKAAAAGLAGIVGVRFARQPGTWPDWQDFARGRMTPEEFYAKYGLPRVDWAKPGGEYEAWSVRVIDGDGHPGWSDQRIT
jgi:hypothetical protein